MRTFEYRGTVQVGWEDVVIVLTGSVTTYIL
jgi:hypothetical protein